MAPINLTGSQVRAIQKWGAATPQVLEVRLFGSRAKGLARPDSDVDLAVTVGGSKGATVPGNYVALANVWEDHLRQATGLDVRIKQYNSMDSDRVRRWCDEFSVILFPEANGLRPK
jgi:predicted nucleotidyltransferase